MDPVSTFVSTAVVAVSIPAALAGVRVYRTLGEVREVSCPETMKEAIVRIQVARAIASTLSGGNELRLKSCSRWPEKRGCDQACLAQVKASPNGCRVRRVC
jgi:hypothetical protein